MAWFVPSKEEAFKSMGGTDHMNEKSETCFLHLLMSLMSIRLIPQCVRIVHHLVWWLSSDVSLEEMCLTDTQSSSQSGRWSQVWNSSSPICKRPHLKQKGACCFRNAPSTLLCTTSCLRGSVDMTKPTTDCCKKENKTWFCSWCNHGKDLVFFWAHLPINHMEIYNFLLYGVKTWNSCPEFRSKGTAGARGTQQEATPGGRLWRGAAKRRSVSCLAGSKGIQSPPFYSQPFWVRKFTFQNEKLLRHWLNVFF